jgi:hypothetical protein
MGFPGNGDCFRTYGQRLRLPEELSILAWRHILF